VETRRKPTESTIGELHGLLANITLALVAAHRHFPVPCKEHLKDK